MNNFGNLKYRTSYIILINKLGKLACAENEPNVWTGSPRTLTTVDNSGVDSGNGFAVQFAFYDPEDQSNTDPIQNGARVQIRVADNPNFFLSYRPDPLSEKSRRVLKIATGGFEFVPTVFSLASQEYKDNFLKAGIPVAIQVDMNAYLKPGTDVDYYSNPSLYITKTPPKDYDFTVLPSDQIGKFIVPIASTDSYRIPEPLRQDPYDDMRQSLETFESEQEEMEEDGGCAPCKMQQQQQQKRRKRKQRVVTERTIAPSKPGSDYLLWFGASLLLIAAFGSVMGISIFALLYKRKS